MHRVCSCSHANNSPSLSAFSSIARLIILTAIVTSLVGSLGVVRFVGQRLVGNGNRSLQQQFLVGLAILTVLALLPFFGGLVVFLVNLFGLGVILLWQFGREKTQIATQ